MKTDPTARPLAPRPHRPPFPLAGMLPGALTGTLAGALLALGAGCEASLPTPSYEQAEGPVLVSERRAKEAREDLVRYFVEHWNADDLEGIADVFTHTGRYEGPFASGSIEEVMPTWRALRAGLAPQLTVEQVASDDGHVIARVRERGTASAPFLGMPATGGSYDVEAILWFDVYYGRIHRVRAALDAAEVARQLGWERAPGREDAARMAAEAEAAEDEPPAASEEPEEGAMPEATPEDAASAPPAEERGIEPNER